jgi:hypothetical protein
LSAHLGSITKEKQVSSSLCITAPDAVQDSFEIVCTNWKTYIRGTLRGFADIRIGAWHLNLRDVAVHEKNGRRWAQLPAKPQLDDNRELIREPSGKIRYYRNIWFDDRELADRFGDAVIAAVQRRFRGAL